MLRKECHEESSGHERKVDRGARVVRKVGRDGRMRGRDRRWTVWPVMHWMPTAMPVHDVVVRRDGGSDDCRLS